MTAPETPTPPASGDGAPLPPRVEDGVGDALEPAEPWSSMENTGTW